MTAPPLYILIRTARAELAAETPIQVHTHHAPKLLDADGVTTHYPDEGGIGLPFTAQMHRLLSMGEGPRGEFLMRASLIEANDWCGQRHTPHHDLPAWNLCGWLVDLAIRHHMDPPELAHHVYLPEPTVRSLLVGALTHAADWRASERRRLDAVVDLAEDRQTAREKQSVGDRLRAEHAEDQSIVWNRLRTKYSSMAPWSVELERRRRRHKELRCEGCPLLADAA
jgi:hypothetical protein